MNSTSRVFSRLFIIVILIKIFDVFKNLVIAAVLGVSSSADIYTALIMIPDSLIVLIGLDTIKGVVNSEYASLQKDQEKNLIWKSFNNLFNVLFLIGIVVVSIIIIFNSTVIKILLPGFEGEKLLRSIEISYIIFPILFLKIFTGYFHSVYNALKKFFLPVIVPVLTGIALLVSIVMPFYKDDVVYNLSFANLAGNFLMAGVMTYGLVKLGAEFRLRKFDFLKLDEVTKKVLKGSASILLLVICNQIYILSRNYFASFFGEGAVSSLHYSGTLTSVIFSLIFSVFFTVLISDLSTLFAFEKKIKAKNLFLNTFSVLLFMLIPVTVVFLTFGKDILSMVYLRGNFDQSGIDMTLKPFFWDALSLLTFVMYIVPTALFLAKKEYRLMTKIGSITYLSGILLNYLLSGYFGFYAISMATFITTGIYGLMLLYFSRKIIGRFTEHLKKFLLMFLSGGLTFLIVNILKDYFLNDTLDNEIPALLMRVVICSSLTLLIYLTISSVLKVNFTRQILKSFKKSS
ncbi:MAG TPA: lipid II flippase MurJ [Ignavibacteria bacterium]|nr:lipid II flippase MurJ [Ignavibacteria bacterium]